MKGARQENLKEQVWMAEWVIKLIFTGNVSDINSVELQNTPEEYNLLRFIDEKFKEIIWDGVEIDDVAELGIAPKRKIPIWIEFHGNDFSLVDDTDEAMAIVVININSKGYAFSFYTELV